MILYYAQTPTGLVIEEILNGKRHFLSSEQSCVEMSDVGNFPLLIQEIYPVLYRKFIPSYIENLSLLIQEIYPFLYRKQTIYRLILHLNQIVKFAELYNSSSFYLLTFCHFFNEKSVSHKSPRKPVQVNLNLRTRPSKN